MFYEYSSFNSSQEFFLHFGIWKSHSKTTHFSLILRTKNLVKFGTQHGVGPDPYCLECLNIVGAVAVTSEHYFCTCLRVVDVWTEIKQVLNGLLPSVATTTDLDLITLKFERSQVENEMTWIIGNYLAETWKSLHIRGQARLRRESVFGFLKFKFKSEQQGARVEMRQINAFQ